MNPSRTPRPPQAKPISRVWIWVIGGVLLTLAMLIASPYVREGMAGAELERELRLAKAEGIITTLEDMKALMGTAPPEEDNACPLLMQLRQLPKLSKETSETWGSQPFEGASSGQEPSLARLRSAVKELKTHISLAEQAATKKTLWYGDDWELGGARTTDFYGPARTAASVLMLRAQLARLEGRSDLAAADIRRVVRLCDIALRVKDGSGLGLSIWMRDDALRTLIKWAAAEPPGSPWQKELELAWKNQQIPHPHDFLKTDLFDWLMTMDQLQSREGRKKLGLLDWEARTVMQGNWDELQTLNEGKLKMVKAFRGIWRETSQDWPFDLARTRADEELFQKGTMADPYGGQPFFMELELPIWPHHKVGVLLEKRTLLEAVLRILKSKVRDESVSMAGLVSPVNGRPVVIDRRSPSYENEYLELSFKGGGYARLSVPIQPDGSKQ